MSDPPKKWGVMRSRKAGICNMPLFDRMTGRSRPHLSLREGSEQPPRSGAESPASPIPSTAAPPFPSPWMIPDRSSPSRVRFAASRPGTAPGRSERRAAHEGKGGGRAVGGGGQVAHDKGYYHSCLEEVLMANCPTLIPKTRRGRRRKPQKIRNTAFRGVVCQP